MGTMNDAALGDLSSISVEIKSMRADDTDAVVKGEKAQLRVSWASSPAAPYPVAIPLRGVVQNYAWGKCHDTSLVAAMATSQVRSHRGPMKAPPLSRGNRFAELWMGTHPSGPSSVVLPGGSPHIGGDAPLEECYLKDAIERDPVFWLGPEDAGKRDLPFLFKVLAVRQALSIQAHPRKALAEELHRRLPAHYPDSNHKPEICIPLGPFEALCGFRPIEEIRAFLRTVPELKALCTGISIAEPTLFAHPAFKVQSRLTPVFEEEEANPEAMSIKELYSKLMRSNALLVLSHVKLLVDRLTAQPERSPEEELFLRVQKDYPGDVGLFSIYFLNYVRVGVEQPLRYIYCAPDEPHAYLSGDCIECMAVSDNVVRAGLTSKHKDVDTLLRMMTYRDDLLPELVRTGERVAPHVIKYQPPISDFLVYEIDGPVRSGLLLPHAAITACVQGHFLVDFGAPSGERGGHSHVDATDTSDAEGPLQVHKGHTFFSRAGATVVVLEMPEPGRLFIATY